MEDAFWIASCAVGVDRESSVVLIGFFEAAIKSAQATNKLIVDLTAVDYVSSAGLRVFLWANGLFQAGSFVSRHSCPEVEEVFTMTGFSSFLTIEK